MKKTLIILLLGMSIQMYSQEPKQVKGLFMTVNNKKLPVYKDSTGYYFFLNNNKKYFNINGNNKKRTVKK